MLASLNRLTSSTDFARTTKSGARASTRTLAGYVLNEPSLTETKIGFIVSKSIGGSVSRHRVTRQLRHLSREQFHLLPQQSLVVVRAIQNSKDYTTDTVQLFNKLSEKVKKSTVTK
ncbi:MAG: ribonuclease P protein component [Acidobacteria bacterium]|nr:ribonuclease P protein component [Acidobacteriota bacterium]